MAISWYFVRFPGFFQEIATAFGLAMTEWGSWSGFAGVRRLISCILPSGTGAVPYMIYSIWAIRSRARDCIAV